MNNCQGEWCVAYHGVARNERIPKEVARITRLISKSTFNKNEFKSSTWGKQLMIQI